MIIKTGDTDEIRWKANADLSGATVRLIVKQGGRRALTLDAELDDPANGVVMHKLTGTLPAGEYRLELEVTRDGAISTYPNDGYAILDVRHDLD